MGRASILYALLVVLHILASFVWFGLSLRLQAFAKLSVTDGIIRSGRATAVGMTVASVLLWAGGLIAMLVGGGFASYSPTYHTSVTLILILVGVQVFGIQRAWGKYAGGEGPGKRVMMWIGIGHLLWFVTLILMLWPQYLAPVFA
jgi:hypothetical protein